MMVLSLHQFLTSWRNLPQYDEEVGSETDFIAYTSANIKIINSHIEWAFLAAYPTGNFEITNSNISGALDTYSNSNTVHKI